ncbi:MAG: peroxiredoxin [Magnetococcales bacterium]|nr:peroxiredoxin [Magnetococcales bacterium]
MSLQPGDVITDMTLPDHDGREVALSSLPAANGMVLYFYPKDNTPGCTQEAKDFQCLVDEFARLGVSIVGVSQDSVASHVTFRTRQEIGFTLLSDQKRHVCEQFGVWREKTNYGKTSLGIVRSTFIVDVGGVVRKVYDNVRVKGHAERVLADCRAMFGEQSV